jgi:general secretion pathway protein A
LFPLSLMGRLHRLSGGVPRVINVLCDRALLGAYVQGLERVSRATLAQAAHEVLHRPAPPRRTLLHSLLLVLILAAGGAVAMALYQKEAPGTPLPPAVRIAPAVAVAVPRAAAPVPAKAIEPVVVLAETIEWPPAQPRAQSRELAYAALLGAWGSGAQGNNPCRQIESKGLRCRTGRGGLDELRQFNRPAMLQLHDDDGEFHATLTALDDKAASFTIGDQTRTVALSALAAQWSGHYTLLWRVPPVVHNRIRPGERGPAVTWLATQLARAQEKDAEAPQDAVFDDALVRRLKQFQLAQGLVPDGALGPQTLTRLSAAGDGTAPTLGPPAKAR